MENNKEFKVCQNSLCCNVITNDDEIFINLANKMHTSFLHTIGQKNKRISFLNSNESTQRRYFAKLICAINKRINNKILDFNESQMHNIKLVFNRINSVQLVVFVPIKFDKNYIIFDLSNCDNILKKYFTKTIGLKFDTIAYFVRFAINNNKELDIVNELISFKEHLRYNVNFIYDNEKYNEFIQIITKMNGKNFQERFHCLAYLLQEHFATLGCEIDDSFNVVRAKYLELSKLYHPDSNLQNSTQMKEKFQEISFAYEALKPYFAQQDKFLKGLV